MAVNSTFLPLSLFDSGFGLSGAQVEVIRNLAERLLSRLDECGVEATLAEIHVGSEMVRYEFILGPGVRVDRFMALENDLALAVQSPMARIVMLPLIGAVGVDVSNPFPQEVKLHSILNSQVWANFRGRVPIALGETEVGIAIVEDLTSWSHLLIGGSTGTGKSNTVDAIIMSLLYNSAPSQVRIGIVGTGMALLGVYNSVPHLLWPPSNSLAGALNALENVCKLIESRSKLINASGCRDFDSFRMEVTNSEPYIVLIVDEVSDLVLRGSSRAVGILTELLRNGVAAGIHVIATISPRGSADLLPPSLKVNFRSRICFSVPSHLDSKSLLGEDGADQLARPGDMLYLSRGNPRPRLVKGIYVSDEEISKVTTYLARHGGDSNLSA